VRRHPNVWHSLPVEQVPFLHLPQDIQAIVLHLKQFQVDCEQTLCRGERATIFSTVCGELENNYRQFIRDFARISAPLFQLITNIFPFEWGRNRKIRFISLKMQ
jgi:hypothetical protein